MSEADSRRPSPVIVAIDGPSGVGKTTVAALVARDLGLPFLSTGAMYRAVALEVQNRGVDARDRQAVEQVAAEVELDLRLAADSQIEVLLGGRPVGESIKGLEIAQTTSQISAYGGVRRRMVQLQREWASRHGAVLEGRDIGTQVFPDTPHKFFLDAPTPVRVERRWLELRQRGRDDLVREQVEREFLERDRRDSSRAHSPLRHDDTYTVIDTGDLEPGQVVERIVAAVRATSAAREPG